MHLCSRGLDIYQIDDCYQIVDQIGNKVVLDSINEGILLEQFNLRLIEDKIFNALIKLRNDLVHNTGILEFERNCYIGFATPCVNENKLAYFYIPFRDIDDRGEAIKLHGRRFFNSQENDIDVFLSDVIKTMKLFVGDFQSYVLSELNTKCLLAD